MQIKVSTKKGKLRLTYVSMAGEFSNLITFSKVESKTIRKGWLFKMSLWGLERC